MQASGAGSRDKWQSLTGVRCGRYPGVWVFAPGEEVGSGCKIESTLTMIGYGWGGGKKEEAK